MKVVAAFLLVLCHLAVSHALSCTEAPGLAGAYQIDAGQGKVVAITRRYYPYFLMRGRWYQMCSTRFKHVTTGSAGTWGIGINWRVYRFVAGAFRQSSSSLKQVDAGGGDHVVGVTTSNLAYCLRESRAMYYSGSGSLSWNYLSRRLKYYSCGPNYGCWGVDTRNYIYVAKSVNPASCSTSNWSRVAGRLKMVEVGTDGKVFGVSTSGQVFQRTGITRTRQQGLRWVQVPMCSRIQHVSYDLGTLWAVTTSGLVMKCT